MPFITQTERNALARGDQTKSAGQACYTYYVPMVIAWRKERRWTTAHNLYRGIREKSYPDADEKAAAELAWQVFFNLHVMPYEKEQQEKNGDI